MTDYVPSISNLPGLYVVLNPRTASNFQGGQGPRKVMSEIAMTKSLEEIIEGFGGK